jgi:hypothetical protein
MNAWCELQLFASTHRGPELSKVGHLSSVVSPPRAAGAPATRCPAQPPPRTHAGEERGGRGGGGHALVVTREASALKKKTRAVFAVLYERLTEERYGRRTEGT